MVFCIVLEAKSAAAYVISTSTLDFAILAVSCIALTAMDSSQVKTQADHADAFAADAETIKEAIAARAEERAWIALSHAASITAFLASFLIFSATSLANCASRSFDSNTSFKIAAVSSSVLRDRLIVHEHDEYGSVSEFVSILQYVRAIYNER